MTFTRVSNFLLVGVHADTKPTTYAANTMFYETDTSDIYIYLSSTWTLYKSATKTETLQNKTISTANNTLTSTSAATGDLMRYNGSKYDRLARGSNNQILTSTSTDIAWATLNNMTIGTALASGDGSTKIFTIAHSLGATPYSAFVQCSSTVGHNIDFTLTYDSTNLTVTFDSAPASGTNNVTFQWMALT